VLGLARMTRSQLDRSSRRMYPATPEATCDARMCGVPDLTMPDVAVIIALVLSSGSLVVSIASFVLAISAKRQAKKAATLGFRVEVARPTSF